MVPSYFLIYEFTLSLYHSILVKIHYITSEILSGHPATCFCVVAFLGPPVLPSICPVGRSQSVLSLLSSAYMFIINHMKPRNVHNSIITTQALVRNLKSGLQEEPGGQDGHPRFGKQALLHQGCSQLHTSRCRAKNIVSYKLY